ncbi:MAG: mechanosensitive ion channel [Bdellovibrionaceae bacterium]|nr:mechanosensitive ion channel [Pseudobdellovibrionaceae bacterium]
MDFLNKITWEWMPDLWKIQLLSVDGKTITLGKVITGVVLFIMGYFICRSLSKEIDNRILSRLDIDASLKHTFKTMIFYSMLIILTLFVLRLLNVPITIFTVLGGALAIGVGFGSQNIVNNFISGLILMIERPVRVGDIIETEGLKGTVENIGARSTIIKSMDNTHYVIPNSSFLEKNVLNWTLSDDVVRTKVSVGVAYGSPTRRVEELLKLAVTGHERILKYPEPLVLFSDFGDNSLNFDIFFWTRVINVMQLKLLESHVRFQIDDLFRQNQIVIAFPQRDIHIDTLSPIQVQVVEKPSDSLK